MINDPFHPEEAIARQNESRKRVLLAVVCAVGLTAVLLVGYGYIRRYHAQRVIANNTPPRVEDSGPKGPPLAHIVIDEPRVGGLVIAGELGQAAVLELLILLPERRQAARRQRQIDDD